MLAREEQGLTPATAGRVIAPQRIYGGTVTTATKVAIKPLEDRIVVKPGEGEETTSSGLVIPDTAKEKPQEGTVVAVGNGKVTEEGARVALDVKPGDRILFGKYSGSEIKLDGEEYLIVREDEILGIVDGK